jgi:tetratricopeptide (TPR) repeat protein
MGGDVQFTVHLEGKDLVLIVSYPKSIREYLGGFDDKEGKKYSARIEVHFDTDANPDTGLKADPAFEPGAGGSEYSIGASEVTTSLARDSQGKWINGPMLMVDLNKERSYLERPDDVILRWEVEKDGRFRPTDWVKPPEGKSMRLRIPASLFGLKAGAKIRVTSVVIFCNDSFPFAGFREATFVLEDRGPSEPIVDDGEIVNQGVDHMQRGEYDSAISLFTQALEVNPGNAEAYHNRGHAYSWKGEHDKAIADYSAAIERDPRLQAAYRYRGFLYEQKGEYEKALADYSQVIAINPGDSEAYMYRGSLYY